MESNRIPPHNLEAEQSILCAIFLDNESIYKAMELISVDDFYRTAHRKIFASMVELCNSTEQIDLITLSNELKKSGDLESVGGVDYLSKLEDSLPTSQAITSHCKIVKDKKKLRNLILIAHDILKHSFNESADANDIINDSESKIYNLNNSAGTATFVNIKPIIKDSFFKIETLCDNKSHTTGIPTGFREINKITSGLQKSDLIILAARPSIGKTTLALDMAKFISLDSKIPVAFFSLEMSKEQLGIKLLCSKAKVNSQKVRTGYTSNADWPSLTSAVGQICENNFIEIDDSPAITAMQIRAKVRRLNSKLENNIGIIIIDYLQLMHSDSRKYESRNLEISSITAALKSIAKEFNVPVLALSQLNRSLEGRPDKRPQLADLRESGSLENDADVVMFIYRDEYYNPETVHRGIAEINIAKQRNGPIGTAKLTFIKEYPCFENLVQDGLQ